MAYVGIFFEMETLIARSVYLAEIDDYEWNFDIATK